MMATGHDSRGDVLAALEWQRAAGVDLAVGERPVDRFAEHQASQRSAVGKTSPAPAPAPAAPQIVRADDDAGAVAAHELAAQADSLAELEALLRDFDGCGLKLRATQLVFADGNPQASVMLIGEAPGRDEDLQGKPFVGRSGQLLDRMLGAIGLDRTQVYIANVVPWRPPGNRNPSPAEIGACLPFLHRQVELVAPRLIMTLGNGATQTILETQAGISRMRGTWQEKQVGRHSARVLPSLHPAYLLRQPAQKALAWRDMLTLRTAIDALIE